MAAADRQMCGFKSCYICRWAVVVQSLSCVRLFVTPWTAAHQSSLSFTISQNLLQLISIESMMLSNHLILCHPLFLLPSIFPSIRVFSNSRLFTSGFPLFHIGWPKYWSFSFSIRPSNEYSGLISLRLWETIKIQWMKSTFWNPRTHNWISFFWWT